MLGEIKVVNRRKFQCDTPGYIYIGRGSALGNPYKDRSGPMSRSQNIAAYRGWIAKQIKDENPWVIDTLNHIADQVMSGQPVFLGCYCSPLPCHGDVIKEIVLNAISKGA